MDAMKLFWMVMALMLVLVIMANARRLPKADDDDDSLELPKLSERELDDLFFEVRKLYSQNTKNVSKSILSLLLNKSYNT